MPTIQIKRKGFIYKWYKLLTGCTEKECDWVFEQIDGCQLMACALFMLLGTLGFIFIGLCLLWVGGLAVYTFINFSLMLWDSISSSASEYAQNENTEIFLGLLVLFLSCIIGTVLMFRHGIRREKKRHRDIERQNGKNIPRRKTLMKCIQNSFEKYFSFFCIDVKLVDKKDRK